MRHRSYNHEFTPGECVHRSAYAKIASLFFQDGVRIGCILNKDGLSSARTEAVAT